MSSIDEIMGAVGRHGDDCIRDGDAASESFEALRELIAAALADARREGADAMREAAGDAAQRAAGRGLSASAVHLCIRALPLPESTVEVVMDREHGGLTFAPAKREPVLLTIRLPAAVKAKAKRIGAAAVIAAIEAAEEGGAA